MQKSAALIRNNAAILPAVVLLAGLYLTSLYNYLLFHSLVELFTIAVAACIFMIAWNARSYLNNNYLLFVGIAAIFIAFLDLFHTLAYQGMGVFADKTANTATQLWVAGRYLQALSLLIAPFFIGRKLKISVQLVAYFLVTGLLLGSIFTWHIFPVAYVEGTGLTTFKKVSEYIIALFFLASIGILLRKRQEFDPGVIRFLILFLAFMTAAEIAFTSYVSVYGGTNLVGHLLRLVAFFFLYKAIIETGLVKPFAILLRNLQRSEDDLRKQAAALQTQNQELDAYDHTVAHNLKNPLTVIIASADAITDITNLSRGGAQGVHATNQVDFVRNEQHHRQLIVAFGTAQSGSASGTGEHGQGSGKNPQAPGIYDQKESGPDYPSENLAGGDRLRTVDRRGVGQLHQQRHQVRRGKAIRGTGRAGPGRRHGPLLGA